MVFHSPESRLRKVVLGDAIAFLECESEMHQVKGSSRNIVRVIVVLGKVVKSWSSTEPSIDFSSGEAGYDALVKAAALGIEILSSFEHLELAAWWRCPPTRPWRCRKASLIQVGQGCHDVSGNLGAIRDAEMKKHVGQHHRIRKQTDFVVGHDRWSQSGPFWVWRKQQNTSTTRMRGSGTFEGTPVRPGFSVLKEHPRRLSSRYQAARSSFKQS